MKGWYSNGQKSSESTYKKNKLMTAVAWKSDGEKCPETKVVDGNGVVVVYNPDGTESHRLTYKDGELVYELTHPYRLAAMKRLPRPED